MTWLVLRFYFHIPYSELLAPLIGFPARIPFAVPIASGIIASFAAYSFGGVWSAAGMILFYTVLRLVIDQVVGPIVLGRAVFMSPVLIIFSFLAGGILFGVIGLILAIPAAETIRIIIEGRAGKDKAAQGTG